VSMTSSFQTYLANKASGALDHPLKVTFFTSKAATTKREETVSLKQLVERLINTKAATKEALPWLKLAAFGDQRSAGDSLRNNANVLQIHGVEADYDGEQITVDRARAIIQNARLAAVLYTSPSHTADTPRWRVLCPTSAPLQPDARAHLVARLNGLFVGALAAESFTLSQSYFFGSLTTSTAHQVVTIEGRFIDAADDLDAEAVGKPKPPVSSEPIARTFTAPPHNGGSAYGLEALARECGAIRSAYEGSKHHALNKAAYSIGGLVSAGELTEGAAFSELSAALNDIRTQCKDFRAAQNTLRKSFDDGRRAPRDVPEYNPPPEEIHPAAAFLAKLYQKQSENVLKPLPVSDGLFAVDGALKLLVDETIRTAIRPQPFLALGAAICAIGVLAGRRYRTDTDLRTNIYIAAVAESGGGKDHAPEVVRRAFAEANLMRYLGGETIASGRAVLSSLVAHPAKLFQIDELGLFLKGVTGNKAPTHRAEIWSELMKLYSRAKGLYSGTEYADQKVNARQDIYSPHACLYGTTTPGTFWSALEGGAMMDGSLARFLVFVTDDDRPERNKRPGIFAASQALTDALQSIAAGPAAQKNGNLGEIMSAATAMQPHTVSLTKAADSAHDKRLDGLEGWARKSVGTPQASIVNRIGENAIKLALIRAISSNPADPTIGEQDVAWGWAIAEHCARSLLRDADRFMADSEFQKRCNKALELIRKHGPCTAREMFQRGFKHPERERREVFDALIGNGVIVAQASNHQGAGRPTVRYSIAGLSTAALDEVCDV
jgi:hypothetical protein